MKRAGRAAVAAALFAAGAVAASGCVRSATPRSVTSDSAVEPRWEDVLSPPPDLRVTLHPRELERDPLYGLLLRRVLRLARQENPLVTATRALDAVEDADEVVLGVRDRTDATTRGGDDTTDLLLVIRGVRADLDPARLVDDRGRPLWRPGPPGAVRELELARAGDDGSASASLFELPGRTWLIATGEARRRARDSFDRAASGARDPEPPSSANPRPLGDADPRALAVATVRGPSLVARVDALRPPALLAPVGRALASITVSLLPGPDAKLSAVLAYQSSDAVGPAAVTLRSALDALAASNPNDYGWLRGATVRVRADGKDPSSGESPRARVLVDAALPVDIRLTPRSPAP